MKVLNLDHFNVRAPQGRLKEVRKFYEALLGLQEGYRPDIAAGGGIWLYAGEKALLHLSEDEGRTREKGLDFLDHIAFRCVGMQEFVQRLDALSIPFRTAVSLLISCRVATSLPRDDFFFELEALF